MKYTCTQSGLNYSLKMEVYDLFPLLIVNQLLVLDFITSYWSYTSYTYYNRDEITYFDIVFAYFQG